MTIMFCIYLLRILFGYPIVSIRFNGIMENAETIAGGWYKIIYDYLMLSYYILEASPWLFPDPLAVGTELCSCSFTVSWKKGGSKGVIAKILKLHNINDNNVLNLFVEDFVWLSHCLNKMQWDNGKGWNPCWWLI